MMIVPQSYALEVSSPTPIASERQHEQYLSVLDKLASKDNPTREEEKYAEVLMTLIEAYERSKEQAWRLPVSGHLSWLNQDYWITKTRPQPGGSLPYFARDIRRCAWMNRE